MIGWLIAGAVVLGGALIAAPRVHDRYVPGGLSPREGEPQPLPMAMVESFGLQNPESSWGVWGIQTVHDSGGRDYTLYELRSTDPTSPIWFVAVWHGRGGVWLSWTVEDPSELAQATAWELPEGSTRGVYRQASGSTAEAATMRRDWQV